MDTIHSISEHLSASGTLFGWRIDALLMGVALILLSHARENAVQLRLRSARADRFIRQ
jgi:hypothetical protein